MLESYSNFLINEDSPYLQQHAHNPVKWYPFSKEAFDKAKKENKLIFLSIGYSTCHWCHVMEEESFEDNEVADILNKYYISIKVDREEMPDIDRYFQDIYYIMNNRAGGWPLTIIMTPDAKPFFSATYIPKNDKYGHKGLVSLLEYFVDLQNNDYQKIQEVSEEIDSYMKQNQKVKYKAKLDLTLADRLVESVKKNYDFEYGGVGSAPKFPHASLIIALLDIYKITKNEEALNLATDMLDKMLKGGIYDQIEGGFFRYSVDEKWMIPHFEKMLYTNAELLEAYLKAYEITKNPVYKKIADELVQFVNKRFKKNNLYFSASDADSIINGKKEEGAYFVYSYDEIKGIDKEVLDYYGVSVYGNFEGKNHLYIAKDETPKNLNEAKEEFLKIRQTKQYPFVDYKILTSWNSLYIAALFDYDIKEALISLDTLLETLYKNGKLYHQIVIGKSLKIEANFEDYSFLIATLIKAYEKTFNEKYLILAKKLIDESISKFYHKEWFYSIKPFKVKAKIEGNAYVSSLSVMAENLLKLAILTENLDYQKLASDIIENNSYMIFKYPNVFDKGVIVSLALKKGYIVIKSKDKFIVDYPFVEFKKTDDDKVYACRIDNCFAIGSKDEVIKKIKEN